MQEIVKLRIADVPRKKLGLSSTTECSFNHWLKLYIFVGKLVILSTKMKFILDLINIAQNLSEIVADFQILLWCELALALVIIKLSYYGKSNLKSH